MLSKLDSPLSMAIERQINQVDRRTLTGDGTYSDERGEVRRAAFFAATVQQRLGLGTFLGSLNPNTGKPQFLLAFDSPMHGSVVVKIYGRRRPHEAAVQQRWAEEGIAAVPILDCGNTPVSWLMMPYLHGNPIGTAGPSTAEGQAVGTEVARIMTRAHQVFDHTAGEKFTLTNGIGRHLDAVVRALERHGYRAPANWRTVAAKTWTAPRQVWLHGDLTPVNLLRARSGALHVIDTCGYTGPPEFDCARWAARVGGSEGALVSMQEWLTVETDLDRALLLQLLGLELLMEAGVREIRKEEQGLAYADRDPETAALLRLSTRLIE